MLTEVGKKNSELQVGCRDKFGFGWIFVLRIHFFVSTVHPSQDARGFSFFKLASFIHYKVYLEVCSMEMIVTP